MMDDFVFVCGHTGRLSFYLGEAQGETSLCPRCYYAPERAFAAAWAEQEGLPALTGSEAQRGWATTIRKRMIIDAEQYLESLKCVSKTRREASEAMRKKRSAAWWIERRQDKPLLVLAEIERALAKCAIAKRATDRPKANSDAYFDGIK